MLRPLEPKQYLAIRYTERLAEEGAVTSVGSRGDSYDNARMESVHAVVPSLTLVMLYMLLHYRALGLVGDSISRLPIHAVTRRNARARLG